MLHGISVICIAWMTRYNVKNKKYAIKGWHSKHHLFSPSAKSSKNGASVHISSMPHSKVSLQTTSNLT